MDEQSPGQVTLELSPAAGRFRSSEGSFVTLDDGRIFLAYTKFTGGYSDSAGAAIVSRFSRDGGRSWSEEDEPVVSSDGGLNVMSVSLLRLSREQIALFYIRKASHDWGGPLMRVSTDQCRSWSAPIDVVSRRGYFVLNNDRVVQLTTGRLLVPMAWHETRTDPATGDLIYAPAKAAFFLSDDAGNSWRQSPTVRDIGRPDSESGLQEPGVVELRDGRVLAFCRTDQGCQYGLHSADGGQTWSEPFRTDLISPQSPLSIKRIPTTGDLLAIYNDHSGRFPLTPDRGRQPLVSAISRDDGATLTNHRQIESDLSRGYHYTAIHFVGDQTLLAYCAGPRGPGKQLNTLRVRRLDTAWFYART